MRGSYRVTKYKNSEGGEWLSSPESEWTSFFDVGSKVDLAAYLVVEGQYLTFVRNVCEQLQLSVLKVSGLEMFDAKVDCREGQEVDAAGALDLVRRILREELWCKLVSEEVEFNFGYDYYMYLVCPLDLSGLLAMVRTELNVEVFESPYL